MVGILEVLARECNSLVQIVSEELRFVVKCVSENESEQME